MVAGTRQIEGGDKVKALVDDKGNLIAFMSTRGSINEIQAVYCTIRNTHYPSPGWAGLRDIQVITQGQLGQSLESLDSSRAFVSIDRHCTVYSVVGST